MSLEDIQQRVESAVRAYSRYLESGQDGPILNSGNRITATDAVRAASAILDAVNLEVFELALWQSWGGDLPTKSHHDHNTGNLNA
jgi:hypothetical protein